MIDTESNKFKNSCCYVNDNKVSTLYPSTPGAAPTAVAGNALADNWGNWVAIIPAATIMGEDGDYFDVESINIDGITANSILFFELQYNSVTVGRGYIATALTGVRAVRQADFKGVVSLKVEGEDLEMRVMSDQAAESVNVNPIMWCSGDPWYS